jgi:hypothetical protein
LEVKEIVYNLFLILDGDICSEVGYVVHEHEGTDDDALRFLRNRVKVGAVH